MTLSPLPAPRWSAVLAEFPSTLSTPASSAVVSGVSTSVSTGIANQLLMFGGKTTAGQFANTTSFNGILNDYWAMVYYPSLLTTASGTTPSGFAPTGASGTYALHWQYLGGGANPAGTGPSARFDAIDSFDGKAITVVGGSNGQDNLSDTWSWAPVSQSMPGGNPGSIAASSSWTLQGQANFISGSGTYAVPSWIRGGSMSYNPIAPTGPMLFGGNLTYKRSYSTDEWLFSNPTGAGTWTMQSPTTFPPGREYAAQATDTSGNCLLVGGKNFNGPLSDTWIYTPAAGWTQITATTGSVAFVAGTNAPSARYGAAIAYDQTHGVFVLFGGITTNGYDNSTWTYTVGTQTWAQITAGTAPTPMAFSAMAYLTSAAGCVLFSGLGYQQAFNDTYFWNGSFWTKQ